MLKRITAIFLALAIVFTPFNMLGIINNNLVNTDVKIDIGEAYMVISPTINVLDTATISPKPLLTIELSDDAYVEFFIHVSDTAYKERLNLTTNVPEIYKDYIEKLKNEHPNWIFEFYETGLTWEQAIQGQNVIRRNSVSASKPLKCRSKTISYGTITDIYEGYIKSTWIVEKDNKFFISSTDETVLMKSEPGAGDTLCKIPNGSEITIINDDDKKTIKESASSWINVAYKYEYVDYIPVEGKSWFQASEQMIKYSMDPRNFLKDEYIFMFEDLNYNYNLEYSLENVTAALKNTFMEDKYILDNDGDEILFADAILLAAEMYNLNPNHLISRIVQEVSSQGSLSSSGKDKTYPSIYNFYNIGACTGYLDGLKWASGSGTFGRPWTTEYKSILGGAEFISEEYIGKGQNTLYFEKFAVTDGRGYTGHQYMTNIEAPASEGRYVYNFYSKNGLLDSEHVFIIPIFLNLPETVQLI